MHKTTSGSGYLHKLVCTIGQDPSAYTLDQKIDDNV